MGDAILKLIESAGVAAPQAPTVELDDVAGIRWVTMDVDDMDGAVARVRRRGRRSRCRWSSAGLGCGWRSSTTPMVTGSSWSSEPDRSRSRSYALDEDGKKRGRPWSGVRCAAGGGVNARAPNAASLASGWLEPWAAPRGRPATPAATGGRGRGPGRRRRRRAGRSRRPPGGRRSPGRGRAGQPVLAAVAAPRRGRADGGRVAGEGGLAASSSVADSATRVCVAGSAAAAPPKSRIRSRWLAT